MKYLWIPWLLPHAGALLGLVVYQLLIGNHLPDIGPKRVRYVLETDSSDDEGDYLVHRSAVVKVQTLRTRHVKVTG